MLLPLTDVVGLVAGAVTTGSLVPQVLRVFKLKSAHEISALFTTLLLVGNLLWLTYGVYLGSLPLILWNGAATILTAILLYAKLRYGRR
jgi:MtN3 and saliva related transmembrane protein